MRQVYSFLGYLEMLGDAGSEDSRRVARSIARMTRTSKKTCLLVVITVAWLADGSNVPRADLQEFP
ncbi:MAG: hypothetical protein H0T53_18035 [Herpetosiphonaceae bacterium]|nr:hypothetical protein [Herpetosiphonaceae bacterium]